MGIREDSKKIAQRMLDAVCDEGTFKKYYPLKRKEYELLLNLTSMRCKLCIEYLEAIGYIECSQDPDTGEPRFKVMPTIVDFLECDMPV